MLARCAQVTGSRAHDGWLYGYVRRSGLSYTYKVENHPVNRLLFGEQTVRHGKQAGKEMGLPAGVVLQLVDG
ncbi:hypothetical protein ACAW74_27215 [Fibrella sp. WM1]